jgi:hypothetical protein
MSGTARRRHATLIAAVGLVVTLAAAGCGGGKRPTLEADSAGASEAVTSTTIAPAPSIVAGEAAVHGPAPTTTTSWQGHVVLMPDSFTVATDRPCIHPAEKLAFTAKGGIPRQMLIYDTQYANNTSNATNNYGTGSAYDKFDDTGTYRTSFVLAATAPPGTAWLHLASTDQNGDIIQARTSFLIKAVGEACP